MNGQRCGMDKEDVYIHIYACIYVCICVCVCVCVCVYTLQARKEWHNILKVMKEKNFQPHSTQQGSHLYLKDKSKALQTSKS